MTESVIYFGIGVAVATLIGSLVVLPVYHRALRSSVEQSYADVRQLEQELAVALMERSKLQREIAAIKRDAEKTWITERIESALFRERINDVANEVARITQTLESPGSLIEPVSGYVAQVTGAKRQPEWLAINIASGEASISTGVLANRIGALRKLASRATGEMKCGPVFDDTSDVDAIADIPLAPEFGRWDHTPGVTDQTNPTRCSDCTSALPLVAYEVRSEGVSD